MDIKFAYQPMSISVVIELEHSGAGDLAPPDLDPEEKYVYGQDFDTTWSILDYVAELNGWQPLSSFCVSDDYDEEGNEIIDESMEQWYDPAIGLQTVSGLLNKFFGLLVSGSVTCLSKPSEEFKQLYPDRTADFYPETSHLSLPKDEEFLRKALTSDPSFNYAMWHLRVYELILRRAVSNRERFHIVVC